MLLYPKKAAMGSTSLLLTAFPPLPLSSPAAALGSGSGCSARYTLLCMASSIGAVKYKHRTRTPPDPDWGRSSERTSERYSARTAAEGDVLSTTTDLGGEERSEARTRSRQAARVLSVSWFCADVGADGAGRVDE